MLRKTGIALLLILTICMLSACGSDDIRGSVSTNSANTASEAELSLGVTTGQTYESKFIGIGCQLGENWTFYTDAQMKELNNLTADMVGEEYKEALKNTSVIYDMYATDPSAGYTINVNLENLSLVHQLALTEEAYVQAGLESIKGALESTGLTDVTCTAATFTLAGKEHHGVNISAMSPQGVPVYEAVVCLKTGGYMAIVTVFTSGENQTQALLSGFYAVK